MNPSQPESAGIQLPPLPEQTPPIDQAGEVSAAKPETTPIPQSVPVQSMSDPAAAAVTSLPALPVSQTSGPARSGVVNATASLITDDDLLEKEWVNKAKRIVEQTRNDPYRQSEDLTVFKADYLQKHYGKTIKIS